MASLSYYFQADMNNFSSGVSNLRLGYHDDDIITLVSGRTRMTYFGDFDYSSSGVEGHVFGMSVSIRGALAVQVSGIDINLEQAAYATARSLQRKMLSGDDTVHGSDYGDRLRAHDGADLILGGRGADHLEGQNGHDRLVGGSGNDMLTGGTGADVFVFGSSSGFDHITDFGRGDLIEIDGVRRFAHLTIERDGGDTMVSFDSATIIVEGVRALDADDFLLG